jgi:hypothetical protein
MINSLKHDEQTLEGVWEICLPGVKQFLRECSTPPSMPLWSNSRGSVPPPGSVKINIDPAVNKTGNAGIVAAICRAWHHWPYHARSACVSWGSSIGCGSPHHASFSDCFEVINSLDRHYVGKLSSVLGFAEISFCTQAKKFAHWGAWSC